MGEFFKEEPGTFLTRKNLIEMARGSAGANLFRRLYFRVDGKNVDALRDGDLACAVFVSNLLLFFGLIKEPHTFVKHLVSDMEESEWFPIQNPKPGAVVLWAEKLGKSGEPHSHVGFYLGGHKAVSNFDEKRRPWVHHETFGRKGGKPTRPITASYWHPRLDD